MQQVAFTERLPVAPVFSADTESVACGFDLPEWPADAERQCDDLGLEGLCAAGEHRCERLYICRVAFPLLRLFLYHYPESDTLGYAVLPAVREQVAEH